MKVLVIWYDGNNYGAALVEHEGPWITDEAMARGFSWWGCDCSINGTVVMPDETDTLYCYLDNLNMPIVVPFMVEEYDLQYVKLEVVNLNG